jgi:hypothetical protein
MVIRNVQMIGERGWNDSTVMEYKNGGTYENRNS